MCAPTSNLIQTDRGCQASPIWSTRPREYAHRLRVSDRSWSSLTILSWGGARSPPHTQCRHFCQSVFWCIRNAYKNHRFLKKIYDVCQQNRFCSKWQQPTKMFKHFISERALEHHRYVLWVIHTFGGSVIGEGRMCRIPPPILNVGISAISEKTLKKYCF